nr:NADH dehydrogenase subunit 3 [Xylophagaidae sp. E23]UPX88983.1 NADH dehydrogenase subunit 3 [Xylophagaidae sp. E81]
MTGFLISFIFCLFVPFVFSALWWVMSDKTNSSWESKTAFECGFDSMGDCYAPFSLRFYILGLLFLVIDVEIVLFFMVIFSKGMLVSSFSFFSKFLLCVFLSLIGVALLHEENEGSFDWK